MSHPAHTGYLNTKRYMRETVELEDLALLYADMPDFFLFTMPEFPFRYPLDELRQ